MQEDIAVSFGNEIVFLSLILTLTIVLIVDLALVSHANFEQVQKMSAEDNSHSP